jgi:hypothetical protein
MTGTLRLASSRVLQSCIVAGASFPAWLPLLQGLGYQAMLILTRNSTVLPLIEVFTPHTCAVWCSGDWSSLVLDLALLDEPQLVGFSDVRLGPNEFRLFETLKLQWISTTWPVGGNLPTGRGTHNMVNHSAVGGVTTRTTRLSAWSPCHLPIISATPIGW